MAFLLLNLRAASTVPRRPESRALPLRLSFPHVTLSLFPRRGLLGSSFVHSLALAAILLAPPFFAAARHPLEPDDPPSADTIEAKQIVYLPQLGGGLEGRGHRGGGPAAAGKGNSVAQAASSSGFTYPGPQKIVSNLSNPTNNIQTILQPELKHPKTLPPLVPAPNLVQTANADPPSPLKPSNSIPAKPAFPFKIKPLSPSQRKVRAYDPSVPVIQPALQDPTSAVKMVLPANVPPPVNETTNSDPQTPVTPQEPHRFDRISNLPTRGTDPKTRLSLSPAPSPPDLKTTLPAGEARGRFAVSPDPSPLGANDGPGSKLNGSPNSSAVGNGNGAPVGNSVGEGAGGKGAIGGEDRGVGNGAGLEEGSGKGGGGTGADSGRGTGKGGGTGTGNGTGSGSGSGGGPGPGTGAFPGITIQGGSSGTGAVDGKPSMRASSISIAPSGAYGLTVVATASSGGGLPDFGVFSNERVYTVYLDMRKTVADPAPSWVLQCALLRGAAGGSQNSSAGQQGFAPPFPIVKEPLNLPADRAQKNLHRMIVVYAVVDSNGKLDQSSVKQSPDPELDKAVLEALSKWTFRPAELNGQAVAVRILLGIPISLNQ